MLACRVNQSATIGFFLAFIALFGLTSCSNTKDIKDACNTFKQEMLKQEQSNPMARIAKINASDENGYKELQRLAESNEGEKWGERNAEIFRRFYDALGVSTSNMGVKPKNMEEARQQIKQAIKISNEATEMCRKEGVDISKYTSTKMLGGN